MDSGEFPPNDRRNRETRHNVDNEQTQQPSKSIFTKPAHATRWQKIIVKGVPATKVEFASNLYRSNPNMKRKFKNDDQNGYSSSCETPSCSTDGSQSHQSNPPPREILTSSMYSLLSQMDSSSSSKGSSSSSTGSSPTSTDSALSSMDSSMYSMDSPPSTVSSINQIKPTSYSINQPLHQSKQPSQELDYQPPMSYDRVKERQSDLPYLTAYLNHTAGDRGTFYGSSSKPSSRARQGLDFTTFSVALEQFKQRLGVSGSSAGQPPVYEDDSSEQQQQQAARRAQKSKTAEMRERQNDAAKSSRAKSQVIRQLSQMDYAAKSEQLDAMYKRMAQIILQHNIDLEIFTLCQVNVEVHKNILHHIGVLLARMSDESILQ